VTPRAEIRNIVRRLAMAVVPHLPRESQINYVASTISREAAKSAAPGLVKDWWYALDDDDRVVDSRHMDWARARSRTLGVANDNGLRAYPPCIPEMIAA